MKTKQIITFFLLALSVISGTAADQPKSLYTAREWKRASDGKTMTADLVHVRGNVAVLQIFDKLVAVEKSTLDAASIKKIDEVKPAMICAGLLYNRPMAEVAVLLGKPESITKEYWNYDLANYVISLRVANDRVQQVSVSGDFKSAEEVIQWMGLDYMKRGQLIKKGILDLWYMASDKQGVWTVFCNPGDDAKYCLVNVLMPNAKKP